MEWDGMGWDGIGPGHTSGDSHVELDRVIARPSSENDQSEKIGRSLHMSDRQKKRCI